MKEQIDDLKLMTIDEAIAHTEERANDCYKNGFKCLGSYYGGYYEALKDIKNGKIKLVAEAMSREKQIEEMAADLCLIDFCKYLKQEECNMTTCAHCEAEALYDAGYCKQSEGEWCERSEYEDELYDFYYKCSYCGEYAFMSTNSKEDIFRFCPYCGAKMSGGVINE